MLLLIAKIAKARKVRSFFCLHERRNSCHFFKLGRLACSQNSRMLITFFHFAELLIRSMPNLFPVSLFFPFPETRWDGCGGRWEELRETLGTSLVLCQQIQQILKLTGLLILRLDAWLLWCPQSLLAQL